jgi:peptidase M23-like protein
MRFSRPLFLAGFLALAGVAGLAFPASRAGLPFPLQLEMRVPFEPTAFPSGTQTYLAYELYLTNFAGNQIGLRRIEVLDAEHESPAPIAAFEGGQLDAVLQVVGGSGPAGGHSPAQLAPGSTTVAFMWLAFAGQSHVPSRLRYRVVTADSEAQGAPISTHHDELQVLGPPVQGPDWIASDGPSNDPDNHHRRGILVYEGRPQISRRYAIDWMQVKNGALFSGDERDCRSYYSYGKDVLAVADGEVVTARDGLPDNVPGHNENFHPAVPITLETVAGNSITLDLGHGQFAHYLHLQPGSLRVKTGDRVRRGQVLARIGNSGDARGPHLHFEVATASPLVAGEGVPYVIDQYRTKSDGTEQTRMRELPLGGMLIDFGQR